MYNNIKNITLGLLLSFLLGYSNESRATHAAGAELTYEHVSDSTYAFIYRFYRNCGPSTASAPSSVPLCGRNTCNSLTISGTMNLMAVIPGGGVNGGPVSPGCPGYPTLCNNGGLPGYEEFWYTDTITLPSRCNFWTFYTGVNARNGGIVNLTNPGGATLYTETTFNNQLSLNNSSPRLLVKPVPYVCINQPASFNHNGFDIDGDSLVYTNVQPLNGPSSCSSTLPTPVPYSGTYSLANPIATAPSGPFTFNPITGATSFTANQAGQFALAVRVDEYRNGIKIGSILRDLQVVVISNCPNINTGTAIGPPIGATLANGYIRACPNQNVNFCIDVFSPDSSVKFKCTSTASTIIPGSTITYTGIGTDSVNACFDWLPTTADIGLHTFTITATDTSCRPPGIYQSQTFSYSILVPNPVEAHSDTNVCSNTPVTLYGVSQLGDSLVWSVLSGDFGSLSCSSCDTVTVNPGVTTTYLLTDVNSICNTNTDTVTVNIIPPPLVDIGFDDTTICQNSSVTFNPVVTPQNTTYTYSWSPTNNLSSSTIPNATASPIASQWYYLTVSNILGGCSNMDSVYFDVIPLDMKIDDKAPGICQGQSVQLTMSGTSPDSFNYAWTPNLFLDDSSLMNPTTFSDTPLVYTVTISRPGCMSYQDFAVLSVEPNPQVDLGLDRVLCQWDTVYLNPTIGPSWFNNYTYSWNLGTNLSATNVKDPLFTGNQTGTNTYILTVNTPLGCSGTDDINITVNPGNFMTVSPLDEVLCSRDSIMLTAQGASSYAWTPGDYLDDPNSATPVSRPQNSIVYTVLGTSVEGCHDTGTVSLFLAPSAVVELGENLTTYEGESVQLNAQGNGAEFLFTPSTFLDDPTISNPTVTGLNTTTTYVVRAKTEYGCSSYDTITVNYDPGLIVTIPNAFTPGGSGPNNILKIITKGQFNLTYFRIYNRWGELVFETKDLNEGWDGNFNDVAQPLGNYVYDIMGTAVSGSTPGSTIHKTGDVLLLK